MISTAYDRYGNSIFISRHMHWHWWIYLNSIWAVCSLIILIDLQFLAKLALKIWAPSVELIVFSHYQAMLQSARDLCDSRNRMSRGWANLRDLNRLINWSVDAETQLTFIVHSPSINVASQWHGDCKLLSHLDVWDQDVCHLKFRLLTRFSPCTDSAWSCNRRINLLALSEAHSCRELANGLVQKLFCVLDVFVDALVVTASAPLVHRSII
jgi:hypothetical protein